MTFEISSSFRYIVGLLLLCTGQLFGCTPTGRQGDSRQQRRIMSQFQSAHKHARDYSLDGIKIGDIYSTIVMSHAPYLSPCDDDLIDHGTRRAMFYAALPCRNQQTFPNNTSVVFFLKGDKHRPYHQPIEAIAFFGGTYFSHNTNFPLSPGDHLSKAFDLVGNPIPNRTLSWGKAEFDMTGYPFNIISAIPFPGDIYAVVGQSEKDSSAAMKHLPRKSDPKIIGIILGEMPQDTKNEQWDGLLAVYLRYTNK